MDNERNRRFESVYSKKVRAGKRRTYFFDVRRTKGDDFYLTLTESTKRFNSEGYERHKIFLYKEDFNRFLSSLEEAIDHVKTELMPDYDYDEFTRRQEEWEARQLEEEGNNYNNESPKPPKKEAESNEEPATKEEPKAKAEPEAKVESEDDMSW